MQKPLQNYIENLLSKTTKVKITKTSTLSGGSISNTLLIYTSENKKLLLKYNNSAKEGFFHSEAMGLLELHKQKHIAVPHVLLYSDEQNNTPFIIMEYIERKEPCKTFFEDFGRGLALMHKEVTKKEHGFYMDNYIGSSRQVNTPCPNWISFFRNHRLGFQIELAKKNNLWDKTLERLWLVLEKKLDEILNEDIPSLVHGDLWSGNYIVNGKGKPCIIDPAVYYGSGEADLAMSFLFGGFNKSFYAAYKEIIPLDKDYEDRKDVYNLYHLLNHLNLFGTSYKGSTLAILQRFAT